jgi:hypothetical protein
MSEEMRNAYKTLVRKPENRFSKKNSVTKFVNSLQIIYETKVKFICVTHTTTQNPFGYQFLNKQR